MTSGIPVQHFTDWANKPTRSWSLYWFQIVAALLVSGDSFCHSYHHDDSTSRLVNVSFFFSAVCFCFFFYLFAFIYLFIFTLSLNLFGVKAWCSTSQDNQNRGEKVILLLISYFNRCSRFGQDWSLVRICLTPCLNG